MTKLMFFMFVVDTILECNRLAVNRLRGQIDRDQRYCQLCVTLVDDEYHFIMKCPLYEDLRTAYIANKLGTRSLYDYVKLMSSQNMDVLKQLSSFAYHAFAIHAEHL